MMRPKFRPGTNIAMKVPPHEYDKTIIFYRDVLGFKPMPIEQGDSGHSVRFYFGGNILWIDRVESISQAEIWLEVIAEDLEQASRLLNQAGCIRRDEIEELPEGLRAFWIASPANIIHLVSESSS